MMVYYHRQRAIVSTTLLLVMTMLLACSENSCYRWKPTSLDTIIANVRIQIHYVAVTDSLYNISEPIIAYNGNSYPVVIIVSDFWSDKNDRGVNLRKITTVPAYTSLTIIAYDYDSIVIENANGGKLGHVSIVDVIKSGEARW